MKSESELRLNLEKMFTLATFSGIPLAQISDRNNIHTQTNISKFNLKIKTGKRGLRL